MSLNKLGFDTVREIGLALPGVTESTAYAMPALKVGKELMATLPSNRNVEANSLVVRVSFEQRAELLAYDPKVYYLTEHYEGFDGVLVRLSLVSREALQGLLSMSHRYVSRKRAPDSTSRRPGSAKRGVR